MTPIQFTLLLVLFPLVLASAFCSAAETALFSLKHRERARLDRISPSAGRAAARLLGDPSSFLVTVLLLNNTVNVLYFVLSSVLARSSDSGWIGLLASTVSVLALILFGEILPKLLAQRDPARWTRWLVRPLLAMFIALAPVRRIVSRRMVAPLIRLVRVDAGASRAIGVEELTDLLEVSAREGELQSGEERLLADVVELGSIRVREVMTPRVEAPFVDAATTDAIAEAAVRSGRAELPLLSGPEGDVLGIVDVRRLLAAREVSRMRAGRVEPLPTEFLSPALFIPELARLDQLLDEFRRARRSIAVAVDEHGTIVGLVTIDDIVRRLVGAGDDTETGGTPSIESLAPGRWIVPGGLRLGHLRDILDDESSEGAAPSRAVTTVAGLVLHRLGRVPRAGDTVSVRNLTLEVRSMRGRRIERILLTIGAPHAVLPAPADQSAEVSR